MLEKWSGSDNTEHAILSSQPRSFDNFRKWLKVGKNEELIHVAGSSTAGDSGFGFSEGGSMYEEMVESGGFCENTVIHFAELVRRGTNVLIHAENMDVLLGPYTVFPRRHVVLSTMKNSK